MQKAPRPVSPKGNKRIRFIGSSFFQETNGDFDIMTKVNSKAKARPPLEVK